MMECARIFERMNDPIDILIAGSGPRSEDVREASEKCKNLYYLGTLPPDELIPLYKNCHIGLCAYTKKSNVDMPDKFYDYTAAGLAIINSLTEEVAEKVEDTNIGLNYVASDADDLYNKIKTIIAKPESLEKMKDNSIVLSKEFDSEVQNKKLADLIKSILRNK